MKRRSVVLLITLAVILFNACSIQKRLYTQGYHITRIHKKVQPADKVVERGDTRQEPPSRASEKPDLFPAENAELTQKTQNTVIASAGNTVFVPETLKPLVAYRQSTDTCDLLVFKNGDEVRVRVMEVNVDEIKYKKCDNLQGPLYSARKSDIFMIKYMNGTREVIQAAPPTPQLVRTTTPQPRKVVGGAIAAFVLSIVGLFLPASLLSVFIIFEVLAIILAIAALLKIDRAPHLYKGKGFAVTALVIALVFLGLVMLAFTLI